MKSVCALIASFLVGLAAVSSSARADSTPAPSAGSPAAPPTPTSAPAAAGQGFYIDFPKWTASGHGTNTALSATYTWGTQGARSAAGSDGGSYWRIVFADRPGPNEAAKLTLRYAFVLTTADKVTIEDAIRKVVAAAIDVAAAATQASKATPSDTAFADKVKASIGQVTTAAKPLSAYSNAAGTDGSTLVLQGLGFKKETDGTWTLTATTMSTLQKLAAAATRASLDGRKAMVAAAQAAYKVAPASTGGCAAKADTIASDPGAAREALQICGGQLWSRFDPIAKTESEKGGITAERKNAIDAFRTKLTALKTALSADKLKKDGDPADARAALTDIGTTPPLDGVTKSQEYVASLYATGQMELDAATKAWLDTTHELEADLASRIESLEHDDIGSSLILAGGNQGRIYDVSTGVIYIAGIHEWAMPVFIAVCPFSGGCLRSNEHILQDGVPWSRALSFDFGVRAQILGKTDPRDQTNPALLLGVSINPIAFVRFSVGGYFFENSQTGNKNSAPYAGVTLNVLEAASVLPVLGLGTPAPPKVVGTSKEP